MLHKQVVQTIGLLDVLIGTLWKSSVCVFVCCIVCAQKRGESSTNPSLILELYIQIVWMDSGFSSAGTSGSHVAEIAHFTFYIPDKV